jgi:hypothetical protein
MSDTDNEQTPEVVVDELASLKARADQLNLSYHPSIGLEKLREKVNAAITSTEPPATEKPVEKTDAPVAAEESLSERRMRLRRESNELVRVRVTCMNPAKKEWEGEMISAGNTTIGTFTKFIPFNTDEGWHVPRIILRQMQERQCQIFTSTRDSRGNTVRKGKLIREFAIEIMPPLTVDELKELALKQAATNAIEK